MSEAGKIKRGKKLYSYRNVEGILPFEIKKDAHKMEEINYYLDSIKPVNSKPIKKEVNSKPIKEEVNSKPIKEEIK